MKNLFKLQLHNGDVNNFKTYATSRTNNLQLVELYIRNVSTKVFAYIGMPCGSINIYNIYNENFIGWLVCVNDDIICEELEMDTLGEVVDFIRDYLTAVTEEYNAWAEEVV